VCAINSKCVNTVGSYRCVCNDGFRQDPKGGNGCVGKCVPSFFVIFLVPEYLNFTVFRVLKCITQLQKVLWYKKWGG